MSEPGRPAFQLRKGEEGVSVFDLDAVQPPLTANEILDRFRSGSVPVSRSLAEIEAKGLRVVSALGAELNSDLTTEARRHREDGNS